MTEQEMIAALTEVMMNHETGPLSNLGSSLELTGEGMIEVDTHSIHPFTDSIDVPQLARELIARLEPDRVRSERVASMLREVVYLCGDGLGCQCDEARAGAADLARELAIVAAGEPAFTAEKVWALAKALHDDAGDAENVPAFATSLVDSLRVSGVAFEEEPFVSGGLLTARATGEER